MIPTASQVTLGADIPKREAIKAAFLHAWDFYGMFVLRATPNPCSCLHVELHGFGADEFHPISKTGSNLTNSGGIGYTIVDTLDTLILMGLDDELARARTWLQDKLSFDRDGNYNVFEVRSLISAHYSV
jgi:mannosyl-oligosaccharide alpha-1,2-mannosidase